MTEITMPKLSDSMEQGTILSWLKEDGEQVDVGDDLVEIEADKATVTYAAEASGFLEIGAQEGDTLPVGAPIARLGTQAPGSAPAPARPEPAGAAAAPPGLESENGHPVAEGPSIATPLARRVAAAHGVALDTVRGSGPLGRITRADVLAQAGLAAPAPARVVDAPEPSRATAAEPVGAKGEVEVVEPTRLQALVARRMAESKATIPHFQVQTEVVMDAAVAFRASLRDIGAEVVPSFNDLIVKAAALALRAHPNANGSYRDGRFERYSRVNVGVAVATEGALMVPTILDADAKGLGAIAAESRRLAGRVRDGSVSPPELSGATVTVSNLGMYGMTAITPVIDSPQAAILGVGAMREVLARVDGQIVDRTLMTLTLSCDHRILYGADAARLLAEIREGLEEPLRLAL